MDLQLGRAFGIVLKTMPYILYRACVYGLACMVVAGLLLFLAVIGWIFGTGAAGVMSAIFFDEAIGFSLLGSPDRCILVFPHSG